MRFVTNLCENYFSQIKDDEMLFSLFKIIHNKNELR